MRHRLISLVTLAAALFGGGALSSAAAQGKRAQPREAFSANDLAKLKWIVGDWEATSPGETTLYQRYQFADDSTITITYYRDPAFTQPTADGKLYLSVGRIYHSFGANRWVATNITDQGLYLAPIGTMTARNSFSWAFTSPNSWTSSMRSGVGGHERVIVYTMKRVRG